MAEGKESYAVLSPLKHDGRLYRPVPGKTVTIDLADNEHDELFEIGAVGDEPIERPKTETGASVVDVINEVKAAADQAAEKPTAIEAAQNETEGQEAPAEEGEEPKPSKSTKGQKAEI